MKLRSFMGVHDAKTDTFTLYVLVEGAVRDCAVYMQEGFPETTDILVAAYEVAAHGEKVRSRDVDALPFPIPSDLTYRR